MKLPGGWNELRFESDVQFALGVLCFDLVKHSVAGYDVYVATGKTPWWPDEPTFTGNLDEIRSFLRGAFVMSKAKR